VLLGNYLDGLLELSDDCAKGAGDMDQDGDIDEDDYNLLFDMVAGVEP
jgi:hypothetical protein